MYAVQVVLAAYMPHLRFTQTGALRTLALSVLESLGTALRSELGWRSSSREQLVLVLLTGFLSSSMSEGICTRHALSPVADLTVH